MERYQGSKTHDLPEVEPLSAWLREQHAGTKRRNAVHNDYKYDNMVLDPADITRIKAVLDWEMCTLGDPLTDLGTALAYWIDPDDAAEMQMVRWGPTIVQECCVARSWRNATPRKQGAISPTLFSIMCLPCLSWQ